MIKILVISTDGYDGWTSSFEDFYQVSEFTPKAIATLLYDDIPADEIPELLEEMAVSVNDNTIIINSEEQGITVVRMN